jgi:hypothetical protein
MTLLPTRSGAPRRARGASPASIFLGLAFPIALALGGCGGASTSGIDEEVSGVTQESLVLANPGVPLPGSMALACRSLNDVESQSLAAGVPLGAKLGPDVQWGFGSEAWQVRPFARGAIIQAPGKCAAEIHGVLYDEYLRVGWQKLGYPLADVRTYGTAQLSHLAYDATVLYRPDTGTHAFWGRIQREWKARGGLSGLGVPVSTQALIRADGSIPGEFTDFERSSLYDVNYPVDYFGGVHPLYTISTRASKKYQKLPSYASAYYRQPSWDTKAVGSGFVSHFEPGGEIWERPEGEVYALWGPILAKYGELGRETGTFGWPRSDILPDAGRGRDCAFFDRGVICRTWAGGVVLVASSLESLDRPTAPVDEIENYPNNFHAGWTNELQGVAHDDSSWYFTSTNWLFKIPLRIPLGTSKDDWFGVNPPPGYNHFGDPDYSKGALYVPVLGPNGWGIAIYDPATLLPRNVVYVSSAVMPSDAPWVAINPVDGRLYASTFNTKALYAFDILPTNPPTLSYSHQIAVKHPDGRLAEGPLLRVQGGVFSPRGTLYLSVEGYGRVEDSMKPLMIGRTPVWTDMPHGLLAFDVFTGRLRTSHDVEFYPSTLCEPIHGCYDDGEELEGLDYIDADGKGIPGIGGQLHMVMLNNDAGDDDIHFKHFRVRSPWLKSDL